MDRRAWDRTTREAVEAVTVAIDRWTDKGLCFCCAITVVAETLKLDREKVESVYIDRKAGRMFQGMELDARVF